MARFVLLRHECPPEFERASHWDLMLEVGSVLRTWAVNAGPQHWRPSAATTAPSAASGEVLAEQLADHRLEYLEYEGPVSGGRGTVSRVDAGTYRSLSVGSERVNVQLRGQTLQGQLVITRSPGERYWRLDWRPEESDAAD